MWVVCGEEAGRLGGGGESSFNYSALPSPPRYPTPYDNAYPNTTTGAMAAPSMESHNNALVSRPSGPEYQLSVGEGLSPQPPRNPHWPRSPILARTHITSCSFCCNWNLGTYVLREEIHLAIPLPHPSDIPITNPNPLATTPAPPTAGVRLSLSIVSPRQAPPQLYKLSAFGGNRPDLSTYSIKESEKETRTSHDTGSDGAPQQFSSESEKAPAFGEHNSLLNSTSGKEGLKRRKPKTNIVKSNSTFISRVIPHDSMSKRIQDHDPEALFIFLNIHRAFQWLDLSSSTIFSKVTSTALPAPSLLIWSTLGRAIAQGSVHQSTHVVPRCQQFHDEPQSSWRCHGCLVCGYHVVWGFLAKV